MAVRKGPQFVVDSKRGNKRACDLIEEIKAFLESEEAQEIERLEARR